MASKRHKPQIISSPKSIHNDNDGHDLPENLIHAILVNLPLKQVFTLKSVSKQWNSIISSDFFFEAYTATKQHTALPWTLLMKHGTDLSLDTNTIKPFISSWFPNEHPVFSRCDFTLPSYRRRRRYDNLRVYKVVSSSHGLLLCRLPDSRYAICNPVTLQWFLLPFDKRSKREHCNNEAFVTKVQAGSVPNLLTFKVIRMQSHYKSEVGETVLNMKIYDSVSDEWTKSQLVLPRKLVYLDRVSVCLDGIVYWEFGSRVLIAYNPTNNQHRTLKLPVVARSHPSYVAMLDVCNGKLQYIEKDRDDFRVWVLEDYDDGLWALKHKVICNDIYPEISFCSRFSPIAIHPFDSNIIYVMVEGNEGKRLRWYDFEKGNLSDLHMIPAFGVQSKVVPFVLPSWPPVIGIAKEAQSRLQAMQTRTQLGMRKICPTAESNKI